MLTGWKPNITRTQIVPFRILKCHLPHIFRVSCTMLGQTHLRNLMCIGPRIIVIVEE